MLRSALALARKDLRLMASGGQGLVQALLLGLLLIFVFSLSRPAGELVPAQGAAAIFWLATAFGQVLIFNGLYSLEEQGGARMGLMLAPVPEFSIWLGKAMAGLVLLLACQAVFIPAVAVFLGQDMKGSLSLALLILGAADWGLVAMGSLLGALAQGQAARESLLSVILFPLLLPVLLAAIRITSGVFSGLEPEAWGDWLGLAGAFDALFTGAALILFPFVYSGED